MTLLDTLKRAIPHETRQRMKRKLFHANDMVMRLENLRKAGFECTGFIDGGAFEGEWARQFWGIYPNAPTLMVEPLPAKRRQLDEVAQRVTGSSVMTAALGRQAGVITFRVDETNSGVVASTHGESVADTIEVRMATLDEIRAANPGFWPNLLKLDLQGHELECLEGCRELQTDFEVIVIEISLLPIGSPPLFTEVNNYLENRGFRLYDVIPQYYRPLDGALFQVDAIYVRTDSPLLASSRWD